MNMNFSVNRSGLFVILMIILTGCHSTDGKYFISTGNSKPGPRLIIYKTRNNYSDRVPVILTADKSAISSYPDINDIKNLPGIPYPDSLPSGYWLDNRGINENAAFLRITYSQFILLKKTPLPGEMYNMILDSDPLVELYDCGNRTQFTDPVKAASEIITSGKLALQKRLK